MHNYHCLWLVSVSSSHLEWMVRLSISPDCFQYPFIVQGDWENLSYRNSLASPAQSKTRPGLSSHLDLQGISHQLPDPHQKNSCIYNSLLTFSRLFYSVRNHPFPVWCDYELHAKPMIGPGASSYYANPLHQFYSISPSLIPYPPCLRLPPPLKVNSVFPFFPSRTVTYVLGADGVRA